MSRWLHSGESKKEVTDHVCSLLLSFSRSYSLFLFRAYQNWTLPTENKQGRVNPLDSSCPRGLTHLSEPARNGWNEGGCRDNSSATLPPAYVPWERRRQRLSCRHWGLFSPCCPGEIAPREHTNGLVEVISLNLPHSRNNRRKEVRFPPPRFWNSCQLTACSESCAFAVVFWPPKKIGSAELMWLAHNKTASVIMAPCYPGSIQQETTIFSADCKWSFHFTSVTFCELKNNAWQCTAWLI